MQKFYCVGRLTRDVEMKETQNGNTIARFSIAVKRPYSKDATDYFEVVAWKGLAQLCNQYLSKGRQVAIVGYFNYHTYEKDGQTKKVYEINAEDIEFLGSKEENPNQPF